MKKKLVLISIFMVVMSWFGLKATISQSTPPTVPPQIIDVFPPSGTEMTGKTSLTVYFNQAMDQDKTALAVNLTPDLPIDFEWQDARTLNIIPQENWGQDISYSLEVDTQAQAENGLILEYPFVVEIQGISPLEVSAVTPSDQNENVPVDSSILVTFNRPVVPLVSSEQQDNLPNPLQIEPPVNGQGAWLNTAIYKFVPSEALQGGTTYTVRVDSDLTALDGATLIEPYHWQFSTPSPQLIEVKTEGFVVYETIGRRLYVINLDTAFELVFTQPMDQLSTEQAVILWTGVEYEKDQPVTTSFVWNEDSTHLTLTPQELLQTNEQYFVEITENARSAAGKAPLHLGYSDYGRWFQTLPDPAISYTSPNEEASNEGSVYPGQPVYIEFRTPMNFDTLDGKIIIEPQPDEWYPTIRGNMGLYLIFDTQPNITYTITILAGAEDIYGNTITEDYTSSFTVGDIRSWARPITSSPYSWNSENLVISNAARETTYLPMNISGEVQVDYWLYQVDVTWLDEIYDWSSGSNMADVPWADEEHLLRQWSQQYNTQNIQNLVINEPLASAEGGVLPTGIYWIVVRVPQNDNFFSYRIPLAVVTSNLTIKRTEEDILILLTDLETATPQANIPITIHHQSEILTSGQTDDEGIFRAPLALTREDGKFVYITATTEDLFAVWYSDRTYFYNTPPNETRYIYTDRPIYRPGETVYFRGVIRAQEDMNYSLPNLETIRVVARNYWQSNYRNTPEFLFDEEVPVTDFGTFSGSFVLPENIHLGDFYLGIRYPPPYYNYDEENVGEGFPYAYYRVSPPRGGSATFTVAEYRIPEFEVEVMPQQSNIIQGEPVEVIAEANYYFGGSVENADVFYWAAACPMRIDFESDLPYRFSEPTFYTRNQDTLYDREGCAVFDEFLGADWGDLFTDKDGRFQFTFENTYPRTSGPARIAFGVQIRENNISITNTAEIISHPADAYAGIFTDTTFGEVDAPVDFSFVTVNSDGIILPNYPINLAVHELKWVRKSTQVFGRYEWVQEEVEVTTDNIITNAEGKASYTFTPERAGQFRLRTTITDSAERDNSSSVVFYVTGNRAVNWGKQDDLIYPILDKERYLPGETANVIIPLPHEGHSTVIIATERVGIIDYEVLEVDGSTLAYELPITPSDAPNVQLTVAALHGVDNTHENPDYSYGRVEVIVAPVNRILNLELTPSTTETTPGERVQFDVLVTDYLGNPVQAEVGFGLTDIAILCLKEPGSPPIEEAFYDRQGFYVTTDFALAGLLDRFVYVPPEPGVGGGACGGYSGPTSVIPGFDLREDFQQTPLWQPHIMTDENGTASVSLIMPDNLTTWRMDARAVTADGQVGSAKIEIISSKPLLVRPNTPRFFVMGDHVQIGATVNNNTDETQVVEVVLIAEGLTLEQNARQMVTIEAGERAEVYAWGVVNDVESVEIIVTTQAESGLSDAARPMLADEGKIPVLRYVTPDVVATAGMLLEGGNRLEGIALPPRFLDREQSYFTLELTPSLVASTANLLDYRSAPRYETLAGTIMRLHYNTTMLHAVTQTGFSEPELETTLTPLIDTGYRRVRLYQNQDGGWGWLVNKESDLYITTLALLTLADLRDSGYPVDESLFLSGLEYLDKQNAALTLSLNVTNKWQLNQQAYLEYVKARAGNPEIGELNALFDQRFRLSIMGQTYLLLAYLEIEPDHPNSHTLADTLLSEAILSATGAHWEIPSDDRWSWSDDTQITSAILRALIKMNPKHELLPNVVRWIMVARESNQGETTPERLLATLALTDWMIATDELQADYEYTIHLNDNPLQEQTILPEDALSTQQIQMGVTQLLPNDLNYLMINRSAGKGVLYYTAYLQSAFLAQEVEAAEHGVIIQREYTRRDEPEEVILSAQIGETVTVRITFTLPQDIYYFTLEDFVPAGFEITNTALSTSSRLDQGLTFERTEDENYWSWGGWWFDHTEIRDDGVYLLADYLPAGTYVFSYQIQAAFAGEFQTLPTFAQALYFPEVYGRSKGGIFVIEGDH